MSVAVQGKREQLYETENLHNLPMMAIRFEIGLSRDSTVFSLRNAAELSQRAVSSQKKSLLLKRKSYSVDYREQSNQKVSCRP